MKIKFKNEEETLNVFRKTEAQDNLQEFQTNLVQKISRQMIKNGVWNFSKPEFDDLAWWLRFVGISCEAVNFQDLIEAYEASEEPAQPN